MNLDLNNKLYEIDEEDDDSSIPHESAMEP